MEIENLERMRQLFIDMHRNEGVAIIFDTKLAQAKGYTGDEILLALDIMRMVKYFRVYTTSER